MPCRKHTRVHFASLLVPQSGPFIFPNRPGPHKMNFLTQPRIPTACFRHLSSGHRVPFQEPVHLWHPYLTTPMWECILDHSNLPFGLGVTLFTQVWLDLGTWKPFTCFALKVVDLVYGKTLRKLGAKVRFFAMVVFLLRCGDLLRLSLLVSRRVRWLKTPVGCLPLVFIFVIWHLFPIKKYKKI
jgi:hypothetical protein